MTTRELISPARAAGGTLGPMAGAKPELAWVRVSDLLLPACQRTTDERAAGVLIDKISSGWDWSRLGTITVAPATIDGATRFLVLDGQHRALAALARGDVPELPAAIVHIETERRGAQAFLAINRDRRAPSAPAVFWSEVAAGEDEAVAISEVAAAQCVTILRATKGAAFCAVGETAAIAGMRKVLRIKGKAGLARALGIARRACLAPILNIHLDALRGGLWEPEMAGTASDAAITRAMAERWDAVQDAADLLAMDSGQNLGRCAALELMKVAREDW